MSSGGFLIHPEAEGANEKNQGLWDQTWIRLERFLPDLRVDLFPSEPEKPKEPEMSIEEHKGEQQVAESNLKTPEMVEEVVAPEVVGGTATEEISKEID
jgi:brefeldin A-resistance guanine nucleotide exchange factor 1